MLSSSLLAWYKLQRCVTFESGDEHTLYLVDQLFLNAN